MLSAVPVRLPAWDPRWNSWQCYLVAFLVLLCLQRYLKLIERLVSLLLSLRLVSVFNSLGPETIQFSLWRGSFSIENVHLKPEFVDSLNLPFRCKKAVIKKLEFHMPQLRYGGSKPAILDINSIELETTTRRTPKVQDVEAFEAQLARAAAKQRAAKLGVVEAMLWGGRPSAPRKFRPRRFLKRQLAFQVARLLDLRLHDVMLHITVDRLLDMRASELGQPSSFRPSLETDSVLGATVTLRLHGLQLRSTPAEGRQVLTTDMQLRGLSIEVSQPQHSAPSGKPFSVLKRWNADLKVGWRVAAPFLQRVTQGGGPTLVLSVSVFAHALLFRFDPAAMKAVLSLHAHAIYFFRYYHFRQLRPQVSVAERPQAWWQHAGSAVLSQRTTALGPDAGRRCMAARRGRRREYEGLYLRQRSLLAWLGDAIRGRPWAAYEQLMRAESKLSDAEIAQFRWWAWARRCRSRSQANAAAVLEEVYRVVSARGKLKLSRPVRVQLELSCPKASILLEGGGGGSFEVAMHQLQCALLAGNPQQGQLQSGTGPLSVNASIAAFQISHEGAESAPAAATSSSSEALPWLVRSPPEPVGKEIAPDFLTLKCSRPALQAADPVHVQLNVAQIDTVYSQHALLQLVAFLNEGYPPPSLDPLMVRASITLAEIVRERLLQPQAKLHALKSQQSQLHLEVAAGDIRMIMPCSEAAAAGRAAAAQGRPSVGLDETTTSADMAEPSFLVVILSGFGMSSQAADWAEPRLTRQGTTLNAGEAGAGDDSARGRMRRMSSRHEEAGTAQATLRAWMQPPDATEFERLQVRVGLEAFLAKPDTGPLDFRDCSQVIDPFLVTASVDHSVQVTSTSIYRRVLLVRMATSAIRFEMSRAVKQELHSLANYMHSNLTDRQITQTFTRHFATKGGGGAELNEPRKSMEHGALANRAGAPGQVVFGERRSVFRRVATATTEFSGGQSRGEGGGSAATDGDGNEQAPEASTESHYGLVLALRVHVPVMGVDLVQSGGSESQMLHPDLPGGLFTLSMTDMHTSLAIDGGMTDVRFGVGSIGLDDLAGGEAARCIIRPTPPALQALAASSRSTLRRAFQAWRGSAAASARGLRARQAPELWGPPAAAQLSGRVMWGPTCVDASLESGLLRVAAEVESLRRALLCACEMAEAKPLPPCRVTEAAGCSQEVCAPVSAFGVSQAEPPPPLAASVKVHLQLLRLDVIVDGRRLATVNGSGVECSWKTAASAETYEELLVRCTGLQVLDRLSASHLYREVLCCEQKAGGEGDESDAALQLAVVLQAAYHEPPQGLDGGLEADESLQPQRKTAVQRLTALTVGSQQPEARKRKAHRRKKKAQAQRLVRVRCEGLHVVVVRRFVLDCAHFAGEVAAMLEAVTWSAQPAPPPPRVPALGYRTITEVVVSDMRLDAPRHSFSPEFYSLSCSHGSMAYPATTEYAECLKPDMDRVEGRSVFERAVFQTVEGCDWEQFVSALQQPPAPGSDEAEPSMPLPFHGSQEHNNKFHHWLGGHDGGLVAQLEEPKLFWCFTQRGGMAMRQVWDGGDITVHHRPETCDVTVWCPWVSCVFGELQYQLLLATLWENGNEPGSFAPEPLPLIPYGRPLPPAPPHAELPGVDKTRPPIWIVRVELGQALMRGEKLMEPTAAPGWGPDLGQVRMRDARVCVGEWPCGSWDITVEAAAAQLSDTREEGSSPIDLIRVGNVERGGPRQLRYFGPSLPPSPAGRWAKVREAVWEASGPFSPLRRGTPGMELPIGTDAAFLTELGKSATGEGFFLEYVMTAAAPATPETPAVEGPHVVEVVLRGARLTLPITSLRSFGHDVVVTYTHYLCRAGPSPHPQTLSPEQWMFANIVARDCKMWVPLPGAPGCPANGLNLTWRTLRAGHFWGGDGECINRLDADRLAAFGHVGDCPHGQALILPIKVRAELKAHTPKDFHERRSISLDMRSSKFEAAPSFGQIPLFHSAIRLITASMNSLAPSAEKLPSPPAFRASSQRVSLHIDSVSFGLMDDRYGHRIRVLTAQLKDVEVSGGRDFSLEDAPVSTHIILGAELEVLFLNSAIDATEPMLEPWAFGVSFREANGGRVARLTSGTRLNLVATPSAFRSVGDLLAFLSLAAQPPDAATSSPSLHAGLVKGLRKALGGPRQTGATLYRIANQSGLKLSYWVAREGGEAHLLRPFQSSDLHVEPLAKSVIMPDSQQPVQVRTICMQFEGNWAPVTDIVVDKVGKYAYSIGSAHDTAMTPVVMDVSLDIRTKVLTVHSPFRIENHTNHPLEFNVHLFLSPAVRDAMGTRLQPGNAAISTIPAAPLEPGAQCYLPIPAVWGGLMYLHAVGWQIGKKDKIDLEGPKLKEKEGLYTCPPLTPGQKPFHCCLKVREEFIKVFSEEGISRSALPEYVLCFQPPLVVHNVLPHPITVTLADGAAAEQAVFTIAVGGFVEVYQFDMSRKIRMSIQMKEFHSLHSVNVHYPPSAYMADSTRKSVIADLPGLRLAKHIALVRSRPAAAAGASAAFGPQTNRLNLRLHNKMDPGSRSREVVVSCPYWIVNKTNLVLALRDTALNASPNPILAPAGLGGKAEPVLFSTSRGSMRVAVAQGDWSWAINLDNLGMHYSFHVLGPPQTARWEAKQGADEGILHFDCERVIAPRNYSPRRNRLVARLGSVSRMDSVDMVEPPTSQQLEVTDPGHVKAKFSCAAGGGDVEGDPERVKRFEFALETSVGPSIFHHTKVITIIPRYVLFNNSEEALQCGQRGTTLVWQLAPGVRAPFHWDDADGKFELCVRPASGKWNWSGAFQIANVGDYGLRVYNPSSKQHLILPVEVSLNGASFLVTVGKEAEQPPYRIENRCASVRVRFQQRDIDRDHWETVEPGHSIDYAWEEPTMPHKLCVLLETESGAFRDASEHDYNLDVIKAFPVVKLRRTNVKIVHKVANTVGRVMTTGINMANKSSSALQSQDQPELDARYVYVGVHADGPTRVMCFSETRDEYTRGTNEESVALLTQKLKALEVRNREVDEQLHSIDEQQNIDMSLVMGAPTARPEPELKDQMNIPEKPSMRLGRLRTVSADMAAVGSLGSMAHAPQSARRSDPGGRSPRHDSASTDDDAAKGGPPTFVRRSLAMIRKVAFPKDSTAANPPDLASIRERDGEGSLKSAATGERASEASDSPTSARSPGGGTAAACDEQHLTFASFSQHSAASQRNLSRFGRSQSAAVLARSEAGEGSRNRTPFIEEIQPLPEGGGSPEDSRQGSLVAAKNLRSSLLGPKLSIKIPEVSADDLVRMSSSPYELAQTPSAGSGALHRLRRLSLMPLRSRTIGSTSDMDIMLGVGGLSRLGLDRTLSSPASVDKDRPEDDANRILGGELVVKVVDAQGLTASWRKKEERQSSKASRAQQLRLRTTSGKGDVYCILGCEGQVKRTALARGHLNPVWKEDIAFKSVQISSDLQVTLFGHSRLGNDVFLGEVVIPLREVENSADSQTLDVRRYILGRRNAKEKVSGEIALACSWRVTPLDVVTMKVKQQQAEVDHKEEILALLREKYNIADAALVPRLPNSPAGTEPAPMHHLKSLSLLPEQDPELKRLATCRGRLSIKVIEGRNIRPAHEVLQGFYAIDGYVQVAVHSEAGDTALATKAERGSMAPVWNKALTFADVALGNSVTVSLFDHKKLSADVLVGQATLPLVKFRSGKPHYLWLPVRRRQGDKEVVTGELHLRVQWASDQVGQPAPAGPSWAFEVQLKGVGLSVIETLVLKFPREAMYALFEDIRLDYKLSAAEQAGSFSIATAQIDNQLLTSTHPVVLSHDAAPSRVVEEEHIGRVPSTPPLLEVRWDMQQHNASINYVKAVSFTLQPVDLVLEEEFLELMVHLLASLPRSDIWQAPSGIALGSTGSQEAEIQHSLQDVLDASMTRSAAATRTGKKWYFEHLDIQGIRCNLTLIPKSGQSQELALQRARLSSAFGIRFMDIHGVPLKISALQMRNAFVTWRMLVSQIYRHLFFQALYEVHKILGQVDILGSPIVLGSNIFEGLATFFKEPLKARTPKQFARGIAKGSLALIKFSAFGFLEAIGQLTGGVSKGLAMMTMDQEYVNRFRIRPTTLRTRLIQGVQAASIGVYEGVIGVIREPINGWEEGAFRGLFVGVYLGSSGLLLKPISGLLELLSRSISGAGEAVRAIGDEVTRVPKTRIRSPRQFMPTGIATGELYSASWKQNLMARLRKGRFTSDELLDYLQNKDNKALLFTNKHLIYINLAKQRVRWSFSIEHLTSVTTSGLLVLLHHDLTLHSPLPGRGLIHFPVRKRVRCRTRDLHQSLLVKLNHAQQLSHALPAPLPKPEASPETQLQAEPGSPKSERLSPDGAAAAGRARNRRREASSSGGWGRMFGRSTPGDADGNLPGSSTAVQAAPAAARGLEEAKGSGQQASAAHAGRPQEPSEPAACLMAIQLLATAASRQEAEPETSAQHLRSIARLSRTCLAGGNQLSPEARAALVSIEDLCRSVSQLALKDGCRDLCGTLRLLCAAARDGAAER